MQESRLLASFLLGCYLLRLLPCVSAIATTTAALFFFGIGVGLSGASANLQAIFDWKGEQVKHFNGCLSRRWSFSGFAGAAFLCYLSKNLILYLLMKVFGTSHRIIYCHGCG